jgi:carbonic anhydrase
LQAVAVGNSAMMDARRYLSRLTVLSAASLFVLFVVALFHWKPGIKDEGVETQDGRQSLKGSPAEVEREVVARMAKSFHSLSSTAINRAPAIDAVPVVTAATKINHKAATAPPVMTKEADYDGLWSYDTSKGNAPADWPKLFNYENGRGACDGKKQSPINIITSIDQMTYARAGKPGWLKVEYPTNKGLALQKVRDTIQLKGDAFNFDRVKWAGKTFWLHDITFHKKSETRVDGRQFEFEAQLKHFEPKHEDILIISVLFELSNNTLPFLDALNWPFVRSLADGKGIGLSSDINVMKLLPGWLDFWHYEGSLTTPPCTEGVDWIVMKNPVGITQEQLDHFPFSNNFRPPQPSNNRTVMDYHFTSAPSPAPTELNITAGDTFAPHMTKVSAAEVRKWINGDS